MNPQASSTLKSTSSRRVSFPGSPRPGTSRERSQSPCGSRTPPRTNIPGPVARDGGNPRRYPRPRPRPVTNVVAVPVELVATESGAPVRPRSVQRARQRPVQRVAPSPRPPIACVADVVQARLRRQEREEMQSLQRNVAAMRANLTNMQEYRRNFVMDALEENEQLVMANLSQLMELDQRRPRPRPRPRDVEIPEDYAPLDAEEQPSAFSLLDDTPSLLNQSIDERSYHALEDEEAPSGLSDIEDDYDYAELEPTCRNNATCPATPRSATYVVNPRNNATCPATPRNATYVVNPRNNATCPATPRNATYVVNPRNNATCPANPRNATYVVNPRNATYAVNRSYSCIEDEEAPAALNECIDGDISDGASDRSFNYLNNDALAGDVEEDPRYLSFVAGLNRIIAEG